MSKTYIIIADKPGYLGNRIVIQSHFISFLIKDDRFRLLNPSFDDYFRGFDYLNKDSLGRFPMVRQSLFGFFTQNYYLRRITFLLTYLTYRIGIKLKIKNRLISFLDFDFDNTLNLNETASIEALSKHKIVFLRVFWLISDIDTPGVQQIIRDYFKPTISYTFDLHKSNEQHIIGIHIRRNDYSQMLKGKYFFPVSLYKEIAQQIIDYYSKRGKKCYFYICTDAYRDIMESGLFEGPLFNVSKRDLLTDFHILRSCDVVIAPPSTFSVSASILGGNDIFYLSDTATAFDANKLRPAKYSDFDSFMKSEFLQFYKKKK